MVFPVPGLPEKTMCRAISWAGRPRFSRSAYGNASDDGVEDYPYDFVFVNDRPLDETREAFLSFLDGIVSERGN